MVHKVIEIHILQKPSLSGREKNMVLVFIMSPFRDMIILSASGLDINTLWLHRFRFGPGMDSPAYSYAGLRLSQTTCG